MIKLPTQPSSIVLEIASVRAIMLMMQDDDDTNREIGEIESQDPGKSSLSSDIEEDDLHNLQEILHLDQALLDKTIRTTRAPQPKKWSCAVSVIARTSLPNLRHPAGPIPPPFLKRQNWTINMLRKSDVVPAEALPLPKAGVDNNIR